MADITMCRGDGCPKKDTCYRHMARANPHYQSYFVNVPVVNGECDHYWRMYKQPKKRKKGDGK